MNARRGLFRLWFVFGLVWIAFWAWRDNLPCLFGFDLTGKQPWCNNPLVDPLRAYASEVAVLIGVPLLVGALLACIVWVREGFRNSN